jgi:hypothetical protein
MSKAIAYVTSVNDIVAGVIRYSSERVASTDLWRYINVLLLLLLFLEQSNIEIQVY